MLPLGILLPVQLGKGAGIIGEFALLGSLCGGGTDVESVGSIDMFDKYDELLPEIALFVGVFGDQLVIE